MGQFFTRNATVKVKDRLFFGRIAFHISKGDKKSESNKSTISLYNLSEKSRGFLESSVTTKKKKGEKVLLSAGYGNVLSNIFLGDIQKVIVTQEQSDIITTHTLN
jgi:hypothetical protein